MHETWHISVLLRAESFNRMIFFDTFAMKGKQHFKPAIFRVIFHLMLFFPENSVNALIVRRTSYVSIKNEDFQTENVKFFEQSFIGFPSQAAQLSPQEMSNFNYIIVKIILLSLS